jgi:hypothetical protein
MNRRDYSRRVIGTIGLRAEALRRYGRRCVALSTMAFFVAARRLGARQSFYR